MRPASTASNFPEVFREVLANGVSVTHLGRHVPAEVMTALLFKPRRCNHPGCAKSGYLERDHIVEVSRGGRTSLDNLIGF